MWGRRTAGGEARGTVETGHIIIANREIWFKLITGRSVTWAPLAISRNREERIRPDLVTVLPATRRCYPRFHWYTTLEKKRRLKRKLLPSSFIFGNLKIFWLYHSRSIFHRLIRSLILIIVNGRFICLILSGKTPQTNLRRGVLKEVKEIVER